MNPTFLRQKGKSANKEGAVPFEGDLKEKSKDTAAKKNHKRGLQVASIFEKPTGPKCTEKCHEGEMDRVKRKGAFREGTNQARCPTNWSHLEREPAGEGKQKETQGQGNGEVIQILSGVKERRNTQPRKISRSP